MTATETPPDTAEIAEELRRIRALFLPGRLFLVAAMLYVTVILFASRSPSDMPDVAMILSIIFSIPPLCVMTAVGTSLVVERIVDLDMCRDSAETAKRRLALRLANRIRATGWPRLAWFLAGAALSVAAGIDSSSGGRRPTSFIVASPFLLAAYFVGETMNRRFRIRPRLLAVQRNA